eukprot:278005_1
MSAWLLLSAYCYTIHGQLYTTPSSKCSGAPTPNATKPWWLLNAHYQDTRTGSLPNSTDITIIGAGIAGSSIIYHLSKYLNDLNITNTTRILLLDARGASGGATGRNAGSLHVSENRAFHKTFQKYGNLTAIKQYNYTLQNVNDIIHFMNYSNHLELGMFLNTITDETEINIRKEAIELMQSYSVGLDEKLLNVTAIQNISNSTSFTGGVHGPFSYNIHPAQIVFKLINSTIMNTNNTLHIDETNKINLNIQFQTTVHSVENNKELYNIHTDGGNISSKIVIFATNAYTGYLLPEFCDYIFPVKSQAIISKPLIHSIWVNKNISGIKSYFDRSLIYYTQSVASQRILILGTDPDWNGNYNDSEIDENMTQFLIEYLSNNYEFVLKENGIETDMIWQGIVGATMDGKPFIGPIVDMPNAYISAGFHGLGLSEAFTAGKDIANMIIGRETSQYFNDIFLPSSRMSDICGSNNNQ